MAKDTDRFRPKVAGLFLMEALLLVFFFCCLFVVAVTVVFVCVALGIKSEKIMAFNI